MKINQIKNKIKPILLRNGVKRAAIFGSYARGDFNKRSDVDILIQYKYDNKSYFDLIGLQMEIEKELKKRVHLLTFNGIHPYLKKEILGSKKDIL
jgi:hypothetical protein